MDEMTIGPTPADETCAQVGSAEYLRDARRECAAFINQLRRVFGPEPDGARLFIKSNPHDFGTYYEVAVKYDPASAEAMSYALQCEGSAPGQWDDEARKELDALSASARRIV